MLDIKKVYIDTRFMTDDSNSHSDFTIELPRSLNVPENTICYITDIVIPVSWTTIDSRNNTLYVSTNYTDQPTFGLRGHTVVVPSTNYNGVSFAAALKDGLNAMNTPYYDKLVFDVTFNSNDNSIMIGQINHPEVLVSLVSSADLQAGRYWTSALDKSTLHSMNGILRIGKSTYKLSASNPYIAVVDLHTIRNIYLTSSSLCSYNIVSNFGNDVIIKKIAVKSTYGQMMFDGGEPGYDYLDVSKRALSRIDFKLLDSYGNIIDLRGNHWSFSLVFQTQ